LKAFCTWFAHYGIDECRQVLDIYWYSSLFSLSQNTSNNLSSFIFILIPSFSLGLVSGRTRLQCLCWTQSNIQWLCRDVYLGRRQHCHGSTNSSLSHQISTTSRKFQKNCLL
jgi:hypothetical protein